MVWNRMIVEYFIERDGYWFNPTNYDYMGYDALIDFIGEQVVWVTLSSYQGDHLYLLKERTTGQFGYLCQSYGSCSHCDILQGCVTFEDYEDLLEDMLDETIWFDSPQEAYTWFTERDWEGTHLWYYREDLEEFIQKSLDVLMEAINE